jgi:hypothetical protein
MAQIYNTDLSKELIQGASIQVNRDLVPNQLAEKVVPVMEVNPKLLRTINVIKTGVSQVTGSVTIYTTPTNQDFFLTNIDYNIIKDAVCDQATGTLSITGYVGGILIYLIRIPIITLTAQDKSIQIEFKNPIKLDRGTTLIMGATYTAGVMNRVANIFGYVTDNQIN